MAKRPRIKWLTLRQIQDAAEESPRAAAKCSKVHWQQILRAGPDEYREAWHEDLVSKGSLHCALCERYGEQGKSCLLKRNCDDSACCAEYETASELTRRGDGKKWPPEAQRAIQALIDKIESKIV